MLSTPSHRRGAHHLLGRIAVSLEAWLRRHPLASYFALAYGISWGGTLVVMSATGFDFAALRPIDTGLIFSLMLLGPSGSGLALTAFLEGRVGLRRLAGNLLRWRVGVGWYAIALLTAPLSILAILVPLCVFVDPAFAPRFQWALFAVGLAAGGFEEIGWTGFATPRMLARQRLWSAGLSLGVIWALWHVLVDYRQNFDTLEAAWLLEFAVLYVTALTAYRLLMTWVYTHTESLLLAIGMHASYTGWLLVLYPTTSFGQGLGWQSIFAFALCLVAAAAAWRATLRTRAPSR